MYPSIEVLETNWDKVYVYLVLFSLSYTQFLVSSSAARGIVRIFPFEALALTDHNHIHTIFDLCKKKFSFICRMYSYGIFLRNKAKTTNKSLFKSKFDSIILSINMLLKIIQRFKGYAPQQNGKCEITTRKSALRKMLTVRMHAFCDMHSSNMSIISIFQ